ncbi:DNA recombination protein rmuC-like protein [Candidatus Blochmanniella vafra str. BVAF]|uniref:DNA recombination protein RmuC n=1 Tax=Blochmanniella vafra (strain BVAF) TaxID=859654 RepID=E8Q7A1_BLOVB|nr:DNA recombination protein RmuC [Candidatus Blochmannia vafer]ADV33996.1 DNA recombination protein rmuC-like protein [Candidatus Blochmannia vafer str. BVAF]
MKIISIIIYITIGTAIGIIFFYIFSKKLIKKNIQKYKDNCITYEKSLNTTLQNLKHESTFRNEIEKKLYNKTHIIHELHSKLSATEERLKSLDHYRHQYERLCNELKIQLNINHEQALQLKELCVRFEEYKISTINKEKILINNEHRLTMQFENLANRIFDQNRNTINEQNRLTLDNILHPLREQINIFINQIQNNFSKEERMRHDLTYEIHKLHQLNTKITQETINLTQALKGNNKIQGNWGEMILTKALEASGMREGYEFHLQVSMTKEINGRKLQPDVIVHLPHGKDVVIDSKISLIAYERYFNSNNEQDKRLAINDHIQSLRTHIKSLNKKNYQELFQLNTLDYILMFIPIESAFTIAIEKESSLLTDAMNKNIMLVSPTTLLIALRTINNLWRYEHQNFNAKKIAEKAGRLYDKLKLFMDDLNKIGQYLNKAEIIYNSAKNKFSEGKGNIISQAENFRTLGVQIKHPIVSNNINLANETGLFSDDKTKR